MSKKISELPAATTPLAGTELVEVVQSGVSKSVPVSELGGGTSTASFAPVIPEATTSRTLDLADAGAYIRFTHASPSTVTVPPQSSVAWTADTEIHIRRAGAGNMTLTPGAGVTLNAPSGGTLVMTNAMSVTLKRVAADVWDVIGQTEAA